MVTEHPVGKGNAMRVIGVSTNGQSLDAKRATIAETLRTADKLLEYFRLEIRPKGKAK